MIKKLLKILYQTRLHLTVRNFKKTIELKDFIVFLISIRVRRIAKYKTFGHNTENDNDVSFITYFLLDIKSLEKKEKKLKELISKCEKDEKILQLLDLYIKIDSKLKSTLNKETSNIKLSPKKVLIENIDTQSVKKIKKILKEFIKPDLDIIIERSTLKFNITIQKTLSYLTLLSTLIFCGGYIYNQILFGLYRIDISNYFNVSDYIIVSAKQIGIAIIAGLISLASFLYLLVDINKNIGHFKNTKNQKKEEQKGFRMFFTLIVFYTICSYYSSDILYSFSFVPIFLLFSFLVRKFLFPYIEGKASSLSILLFSKIFFAIIISNSISDFHKTKLGDNKYIVVFSSKELNTKYKDYNVITANSNYVFMHKDKDTIEIIKRDLINSFKYYK
ncbi:hypothetical protein [Wenyingzhuangia sp. IMCC45574]